MFESVVSLSTVEVVLKQLTDVVDAVLSVDLTGASQDELLDLARGVETQRRRLPVADHRLIAELESRGVAFELGCASAKDLLVQLLRIDPGEAKQRVTASHDLGPRRGMTGEVLEPIFPELAAAQAEGAISDRHAAIIRHTVDHLPSAAADQGADVEASLTKHARRLRPDQLATAARRLVDCLDPDGTLADEHDQARRRDVTLTRCRDGSARLAGQLTAGCAAVWQAVFDALAAPVPAEDGERDPRTAGQRRHDAFEEVGRRALRAGELPDCGGTPATVLITLSLDQLESRLGYATTSHGGLLSVAEALRLAAEAEVIPVVLGDGGGVLGYGTSRRVASPGQRRALAARDGGCSFPACDRPAGWCQAHHVTSWVDGGATDLDNLTLLCGYHHREFAKRGWACQMIDGLPHWIPPAFLDPDQTPRRNSTCRPDLC